MTPYRTAPERPKEKKPMQPEEMKLYIVRWLVIGTVALVGIVAFTMMFDTWTTSKTNIATVKDVAESKKAEAEGEKAKAEKAMWDHQPIPSSMEARKP
jgi:hypothetical protein